MHFFTFETALFCIKSKHCQQHKAGHQQRKTSRKHLCTKVTPDLHLTYSKQVAQRATIAHLSPICQGQISFQKTYKWAMETRGLKSNSSKLLCLSWLPATLMVIRAWKHHFPIISLWEIFSTSRAANSVVSGPIWLKFDLVRDFMHILVTCKYKNDRIKNNREKRETSFSPLKVNGGFLLPWKPEFWSNLHKTLCSLSPTPMMLHIKFNQDRSIGFRDIQVQKCKISSLKGMLLQNEWSDSAQNRTRPSFYACPGYQQLWW